MYRAKIGHFYIVGAPRSGTTLLQSLVGAHSQVATWRELDFFSAMYRNQRKRQRILGLPANDFRKCYFRQFLERTQVSPPHLPLIFCRQYANFYVRRLDELACRQGKSAWLDKTPDYIRYIDKIEHFVSDAKFVHIIRNGPDTVASIYDAHLKYPFTLPWQNWSLSWAIDFWLQAVLITLQYATKPNHYVVGYADLTEDTEKTLQGVFGFLQLPFEPEVLEKYRQMPENIDLASVDWQKGIKEPIKNRNREKFTRLFSPDIQAQIMERLSKVNVSQLPIRP